MALLSKLSILRRNLNLLSNIIQRLWTMPKSLDHRYVNRLFEVFYVGKVYNFEERLLFKLIDINIFRFIFSNVMMPVYYFIYEFMDEC